MRERPYIRRKLGAGAAGGGFAPTPPGFNALVPLPMRVSVSRWRKGDAVESPGHRSRPLSRRSGCFPALALSSAHAEPNFTAAVNGPQLCAASSERDHTYLRESGSSEELAFPQGGTQHVE